MGQNNIQTNLGIQNQTINTEISPRVQNIETLLSPQQHMIQTQIVPLVQDITVDFSSSIIYAFSPSAKVERVGDEFIITIIDKDGTTVASFSPFGVDDEKIQYYVNQYLNNHNLIAAHNTSSQAHQDIRRLIEAAVASIPRTAADIGLDQVDNTSDLDKPVSIATQLLLDMKSTIYVDTIQNWNNNRDISQDKTLYVYSNYKTREDQHGNIINIPGLKLGDGQAYIIDLPFISTDSQIIEQHLNNRIIHITNQERQFWNNKVRVYLNENIDQEEIIFTTH